jgi:hypothetical protein
MKDAWRIAHSAKGEPKKNKLIRATCLDKINTRFPRIEWAKMVKKYTVYGLRYKVITIRYALCALRHAWGL